MQRIAVVTGAAQGIGRALTQSLLAGGWRVAALDVDAEALAETGAELDSPDLLAVHADVGNEADVDSAFARWRDWQRACAQESGLDLLVNNAGLAHAVSGPIEELELARWKLWIDSHLTGAFVCTRAAVDALRARRGCIVNIASTRALQSEPHGEAYAAAKGGLLSLTHALAISLGPEIRVNAICPGWIETRPWKKRSAREVAGHREVDRTQHPVGRVGEPVDVVAMVEFLAGPGAGFVTGQHFVVDGGMTRKMLYEQ
jgi:NAD(P)-dependent dehydrogenase (short-subunit alcohol dehydrogenase family)